jgi:hypothetical protein
MEASTAQANEPQADGAKPGARDPVSRFSFNADARVAEREQGIITIGEQGFVRVRKNWDVTRALRGLLRVQEKSGITIERLDKQVVESADESQLDGLWRQRDEQQDSADEAAYEIIALLLKDTEGNRPPVEHLKEWLDVQEAGDLAGALSTGREPDPSQPTPSGSAS